MSYASPSAMRSALTGRLRRLAPPHGPWPLADLHRQFAYDRLLARLYEFDPGWVLKGAATAHVEAAAVMTALRSEAGRRDLRLPDRFEVPDRTLWTTGYAAEARRCYGPVPATLDAATAAVNPFLDPLLDGSASGSWDPVRSCWMRPGQGAL